MHRVIIIGFCLLASGTAAAAGPRAEQFLVSDWRFALGDPEQAAQPDFDDGTWNTIELPHTWNALDGQDGGADYHRGIGWYRRNITLSNDGRRSFLRFGAANAEAHVWLDGKKLTEHRGGHTAFCVELPTAAHDGQPHTLAVRVSNRHDDDIPPWSADFTFYGGLYRPVRLIRTASTCISPLDHASSGVKIVTGPVSREVGAFAAEIRIDAAQASDVLVRSRVRDADGRSVATSETALHAKPGDNPIEHAYRIPSPRLWHGKRDPHLYKLTVQIVRDGEVVDEVAERFGLRSCRIDPERGFLLNGEPYSLRGVNKHQDRLDKGWAISEADIREDFAIIDELGATAVRLAHYPHDPLAYALCDEMGLVAWAEIPLVNRVNLTRDFLANATGQLREMIRQYYNHPSIVVWGIMNEITASWVPGPDPTLIVRSLNETANREDPTRLTTCAATTPWEHDANWITDATTINLYTGWYGGDVSLFGKDLDGVRALHRDRPLGLGEYGAGGSIVQHEVPPRRPEPTGPWHPEEYQAEFHEQTWRAIKERPWLWATFVWNMFDFAADQRSEGDHPGRNDKGLVTYDRKTRKDAFYFYKADWSREPVLHIADRRYTDRTAATTRVKVYANAERVALRVNGRDLGEKAGDLRVFLWDRIELQPGENRIEVRAVIGGRQLTDACVWTLRQSD